MSVASFIHYITYERRYSGNTVKAYDNDLHAFTTFLESTYNLSDPVQSNHEMIRSWIVKLMDEGISPRSVNRKISSLKSYFKYLLKEGVIERSPVQQIVTVRASKQLPSYISQEDIIDFLNQPVDTGDFKSLRDKIIIEILYSTGIRRSELISLKNSSIDNQRSLLKVTGKGNKERIIPLSKKLLDHIQEYTDSKQKTIKANSPYLIVTDKGKKVYPKFILRKVKSGLSGLKNIKKSPHILRHTFATHMLNNGADLNVIKELLGHADLTATQVYTHNTIKQLKSIYKKAHPRA